VPADGVFDIDFVLFPTAEGGAALATHSAADVGVQGGLFATELDYTAVPFAIGDQYWIELRVRPGASTGGFQQLLPRQKITPAPYALAARYVVGTGGVSQQALAAGAVGTQLPLQGDGRSASPVRIASGGITGGYLAANSIASDKLSDEPGVASANGGFTYLESTGKVLAQVTINAPAAGTVLLIGHMDLSFHRSAATPNQIVYVGLYNSPGTVAGNASAYVPAGTPGTDVRTTTTSTIYNVAAGSHTFYLNAREGSSTGDVQVKYPKLQAIYFRTAY